MADLNELRAEVLRRQQAAQRKVARLRRKGVNISGTPYDVRRNPENIGRYNSRQLQSYLNQLNSFVDRRTSFVGGVEGMPIPREKWQQYKRVEKAYRKRAEAHYETVKDTFIPQSGLTVEGFDKKIRRKREPGKGGVPRPMELFSDRMPYEVLDEKKLARLQKNLEKKLQADYLPKEVKRSRKKMLQAVAEFGDKELTDLAKSLTDEQVDTLWNYTDAPRDIFSGYHYMRLLSAGKADEAQANIHEDAAYETKVWLQWAKELPPRGNR